MNVAELIEEFRRATGDRATPPLWSDEFLIRSFSLAEQQAARRANLLFDNQTPEVCRVTLADGQRAYRLHPKVYDVLAVHYVAPNGRRTPLTVMDDDERRQSAAHLTAPGRPARYQAIEDAASASGMLLALDRMTAVDPLDPPHLEIEVYRLPLLDLETVSDEPEIPERHHDGLLDFVLYRAYRIRDMEAEARARAADHLALFTARFGELPSADVQRQRQRHRARTVRPIGF